MTESSIFQREHSPDRGYSCVQVNFRAWNSCVRELLSLALFVSIWWSDNWIFVGVNPNASGNYELVDTNKPRFCIKPKMTLEFVIMTGFAWDRRELWVPSNFDLKPGFWHTLSDFWLKLTRTRAWWEWYGFHGISNDLLYCGQGSKIRARYWKGLLKLDDSCKLCYCATPWVLRWLLPWIPKEKFESWERFHAWSLGLLFTLRLSTGMMWSWEWHTWGLVSLMERLRLMIFRLIDIEGPEKNSHVIWGFIVI